jgi:hypothetical protein
MLAVGLVIMVVVLVFVITLASGTRREAEAYVQGDRFVITGQYGQTYALADISEVRLVEAAPVVGRKVRGAGLGIIRKGDYEVAGLGTSRLFLHSDTGPYLYLKANGKWTILNFGDPDKTVGIHDRLRQSWPAPK